MDDKTPRIPRIPATRQTPLARRTRQTLDPACPRGDAYLSRVNGTFFFQATLLVNFTRKVRFRRSLHTRDRAVARKSRDLLLRQLSGRADVVILAEQDFGG